MKYKIKRIINFIISTFLTKKLLISIIIFLLCFLLINNVFATTYPFTFYRYTCNSNNSSVLSALENITQYQQKLPYSCFSSGSNFLTMFFNCDDTDVYCRAQNAGTNIYYRFYVPANTTYYQYQYNSTTHEFDFSQSGTWNSGSYVYGSAPTYSDLTLNSSITFYNFDDNSVIYDGVPYVSEPIFPYLADTDANLTSLNMTYLTVDSGDQNLVNLQLHISTGVVGSENMSEVYTTTLDENSPFYNSGGTNGDYYEIPVSIFKNRLVDGYEVHYILFFQTEMTEGTDYRPVIYTPAVGEMTDTKQIQNTIQNNFNILNNNLQNSLNQQTNVMVEHVTRLFNKLNDTANSINSGNEIAQDTNNFLKNQNFDNSNLGLPTSNQQDITQDGINNIFTMIYNSFTSGQAPDVVIPVPFTGKSFTIQANFLRNILSNTSFSFISNIIELFWWYIISKFIITDIANKMNKIKSGDFENLENSNIKEEML